MAGRAGERGSSTVEAAFGVAALVSVLLLCLAGLAALAGQVRCVDAAREAARLAARGDVAAATRAAERIAPAAAQIRVRRDGDFVVVTVGAGVALLPGLRLGAESVAAVEKPGR